MVIEPSAFDVEVDAALAIGRRDDAHRTSNPFAGCGPTGRDLLRECGSGADRSERHADEKLAHYFSLLQRLPSIVSSSLRIFSRIVCGAATSFGDQVMT